MYVKKLKVLKIQYNFLSNWLHLVLVCSFMSSLNSGRIKAEHKIFFMVLEFEFKF